MFKKLKEVFKQFANSITSLFREETEKPSVQVEKAESTATSQPTQSTQAIEIVAPSKQSQIPLQKVEEKREEKPSIFQRIAQRVSETIAYTRLSEDKVEKLCENLFTQLIECDVAVEVSEQIVNIVRERLLSLKIPRFGVEKERIVKDAIKDALLKVIEDVPDVDFMSLASKLVEERKPVVVLFLGPNGYGKTTTIAKIGYLLKRHNYSVVFAAADTFRAGAIEQLEEHGKRLGIRVIKHRYGADPAAVVHDAIVHAEAKGIDFVLVDTAGRMHTDVNLMDELRKIYRVAEPDLSIFVADALLGNEALEVAKTYSKYVNIDGLVITKVDAYPKGGSILTFLVVLRKPIFFLGTGQNYEDLMPFRKEWFIGQLLE